MLKVIDKADGLLREAMQKKSNDILLDKYTIRHLRYIDVEAALNWIQEERTFGKG